MVKRREEIKKDTDKKKLDNFIKSSPEEVITSSKDMLERESFTFRINRELWTDFDYWCKKNRMTRSDVLENYLLEKIGKSKDDYRKD